MMDDEAFRTRQWLAAVAVLVLCLVLPGCGSNRRASDKTKPSETSELGIEISPQLAARRALQRQDLATAKEQIRQALLSSPEDGETLKLAAEIAFADGDQVGATEWLIQAARQGDFEDQELVQQCATQLLSFGKLFETIDLLKEVVGQQPRQSETRRNLFYFLVNAEQHRRARHHGQLLIRQRAFDKTVLFWMATHEQRDISPSSMNAFFKLNPLDRRLEIAKLRVLFDNEQWDQFQSVADQILSSSPDFLPAQLLLGQSYIETGQFERLPDWAQNTTSDAKKHWRYWEVLGDWGMHSKRYAEAARAYYEATRRDQSIDTVALKLARCLQFCDDSSIPPHAIKIASDRGELLNRFLQEKERYHKLHRRSCAAIAEMATTLEQLGRLWEAEAWTAIGIAEPDIDVGKVKQIREQIVRKLDENTPWQLEKGHPFVSLDLGFLPLPKEELFVASKAPGQTREITPSALPVLVEESQQRGLIDAPREPVTVAGGVIPLYAQLGFGGAAVDYDFDGWTDIYVASCGQEPLSSEEGNGHLFRNIGGHFVDTSELAGIDDRGFAQGVAAGDINEDGFVDLVLLNYGFDQVFVNNGDGTFVERKRWIKNPQSSWSTTGAVADIDLDGISDFVCLQYCTAQDPLQRRCTAPATNSIEYCVPTDFDAELDQFFRGQSEGMWINANEFWNAVPTNPGRGLGIIVGQLDGAQGTDVYVANDMTSNHFWSVVHQERFELEETATIRGLALDGRSRPQASMGIAADDFDMDGDIDLLVTNFEQEYNTLYEQTSPGIWQDKSRVAGVAASSFDPLGFGVQAVDLDNDSQLELVVANGHVHHNAEFGYAQLPQVLRRTKSGRFETIEPSRLTNYFRASHVGRALWALDIDRDHLLDLVVTHQRESTALLHNQTADAKMNHWLRVRLVGRVCARDAVGSVVTVSCGDVHLTRSVIAGDGYFCSGEDTLHFGFGPSIRSTDVQIKVRWPHGASQTYRSSVDQECLIVEGDEDVFVYPAIAP